MGSPGAILAALLLAAVLGRPDGVSRRAWLAVAVVAGALPDLDLALLAVGPGVYTVYHATATHSLLGLAVLTPAVVLVAARVTRTRAAVWWALVGGALAAHVTLTAASVEGAALLYPLSEARIRLGWLHPFDPWLWTLLLVLWWAVGRLPRRRRRALVAGAAVVAWVGAGALLSWLAASATQRLADAQGLAWTRIDVSAVPGDPTARRALVVSGDFVHEVLWSPLAPAEAPRAAWPTNLADPLVRAALATPQGEGFARWAETPVARIAAAGEDVWLVELRDLRWQRPGVPDAGPSLVARVQELRRGTRLRVDRVIWHGPWTHPPLPGADVPAAGSPIDRANAEDQ